MHSDGELGSVSTERICIQCVLLLHTFFRNLIILLNSHTFRVFFFSSRWFEPYAGQLITLGVYLLSTLFGFQVPRAPVFGIQAW